jgi:succinate-semialdehyde dehydrogenase/glutarate-semialdehyde dehydrogenase
MLDIKTPNHLVLTNQCYVDGKWIGDPVDPVKNPATGDMIAHVPNFGAEETIHAIEAAEQAFRPWATRTAKDRAQILKNWYESIVAHREDLAVLLTTEQGKPLAEARIEIDTAAAFVEFYAEEARRIYGETIPSHRADSRIIVIRQPIGVIAAITPWNFPASMLTRKVSPALAAGCTAVVKPSPETPLSALALAKLAEEAGLPPGVLNVITGDAKSIGAVMTSHRAVRVVTFTGSTAVGKLLMKQASDSVKKVGLELGGNAPFIVFDDADIDTAVDGAVLSKFRNMGQTCVCANRIYVQNAVYDTFVEKLAAKVDAFKIGNGIEPGVVQGPLINLNAVAKVEQHIADAVNKGARIVSGGARHQLGGTFFQPTVLADVTSEMLIAQEETFGPVAPVFRFTDEADVICQANATDSGLAAYFYARDIGRVFRVAENLEYGMVGINTGALASEVAPFGGVKESGIGREGSRHGIEEFTELKYMLFGGLSS